MTLAAAITVLLPLAMLAEMPASDPGIGQQTGTRSIAVVLPTPAPREFDLALDEIELAWSSGIEGEPRATYPGSAVVSHGSGLAVLSVSAQSLDDLRAVLAAEERGNAGTEGRVVLYERGRDRTASTRQLLTPEIAVVLDGVTIGEIAARAALLSGEPIPGAPGAYVVRAASPLAALDAVRQLASVPGVKSVYPLLKQSLVLR